MTTQKPDNRLAPTDTAGRRALIEPLLTAGLNIQQIADRTGISRSAVSRACRHLRANGQPAEPPESALPPRDAAPPEPQPASPEATAELLPAEVLATLPRTQEPVVFAPEPAPEPPPEPSAPPPPPKREIPVCAYCGRQGKVGYSAGDLTPARVGDRDFLVHSDHFDLLVKRLRSAA